ncbi:MAG: FMN-binding protein [Eggerthellaceae bacterium]|nr:FMN-binding protein [Eggerthellaceae bacterium]
MRAYLARRKYFYAKAINAAVIVALIVAFGGWAAEALAHDAEVEAQIIAAERAASRGAYPVDGVFEGSAQGFGGPVAMRVTIEGGYIDSVEIVDASMEDAPWLEMCLGLPDAIVKAQNTSIDVVSGATFTSSGILNGTTEALRQALEGGA